MWSVPLTSSNVTEENKYLGLAFSFSFLFRLCVHTFRSNLDKDNQERERGRHEGKRKDHFGEWGQEWN